MRNRRTLFVLAALLACAPQGAPGALMPVEPGITTVIVVRHAEKAAESVTDPPLTVAGVARAEALVDAVRRMPVRGIMSTDFVRTRSTAAPLAARLGLTTELVDARARDHARSVAASVLARYRGETVVIVGHSNTVPDIVAAFGAPKPAAICDAEYDNLFVVRVSVTGAATVERRTYGAASMVEVGCGGMR